MTPILTSEAFAALGGPNLVYVRPVLAKDVLGATRVEEVEGIVIQGVVLEPEQVLYALHRADGERLAVMADRETAVAAALAHEMAPVSVH